MVNKDDHELQEVCTAMPMTEDPCGIPAAVYVDQAGQLQLQGHRNLLTSECIRRSTVLSHIYNAKCHMKDVFVLEVALPISDAIATAWIAAVHSDDKSFGNISAKHLAMTLMVGHVVPLFPGRLSSITCDAALLRISVACALSGHYNGCTAAWVFSV